MKKFLPILALILAFNISINAQVVQESVSMGSGYANDVFYSFQNGVVQTSDRAVWDIAFATNAMSAAIISNKGAGVEVYEYANGDTSHWAALDTTGLSGWPQIYNSDTTWEEGALNQNATGHPDYGWCLYNSVSHNLHGHKLYVLKWADGSFKKLWVKRKYSSTKTYVFEYSDLDNSNNEEVTLDCNPYTYKNFIYYSLINNEVIDYEPSTYDWDIVFTRYYDHVIPYFVTGALLNYNTMGAVVTTTDYTTTDYSTAEFTEDIAIVGSEWKEFNMTSFAYDIVDSTVYFVQNANGDIYRLVFSGFAGMSSGDIDFNKELLFTSSIFDNDITGFSMTLFPNPTSNQINILYSLPENMRNAELKIYDLTGRQTYHNIVSNEGRVISINDANLIPGTYIVEMSSDSFVSREKLIVQ